MWTYNSVLCLKICSSCVVLHVYVLFPEFINLPRVCFSKEQIYEQELYRNNWTKLMMYCTLEWGVMVHSWNFLFSLKAGEMNLVIYHLPRSTASCMQSMSHQVPLGKQNKKIPYLISCLQKYSTSFYLLEYESYIYVGGDPYGPQCYF